MRGVRTSEERKSEVLRLLDAGWTTRQLANLLDVSKSKVSEIDGDERKKRRRERDREHRRNELYGGELLTGTVRDQIKSYLPFELDDAATDRLLDRLEMNASLCRVRKPKDLSFLASAVSAILDEHFGDDASAFDVLRTAKAEITETLRRSRGAKPRKLNLGEVNVGTAARNRAMRAAPREPESVMVAVGVALRSGERAPLLTDRIEKLIHERGLRLRAEQPEKYRTIEKARVAEWDMEPELKRAYHELALIPVSSARTDPVLSEKCRRLVLI